MLRIGPTPPPSGPAGLPPGLSGPGGPPPSGPPSPPMLPMAPDPSSGGKYDAEKVKPETARYLTSDQGPFECQNCHHFDGQGGCEIVSGPIDPEGVCCLFESAGGGSDDSDEGSQDDESGGAANSAPPIPTANPLG